MRKAASGGTVSPARRIVGAAGVLAGAGALGIGYASVIELHWFRLGAVEIPVLDPGSDPIRLLHISDLHMLGRHHRKQAFIRGLAKLRPDVVIHTGDTLSGPDGVPAVLDALAGLRSVPGAFVFGSNDYLAPVPKNPFIYFDKNHKRVAGAELPWRELRDGLVETGWLDLTNTTGTLKLADGRRIDVRGLDDPHLKADRFDRIAAVPPDPDADVRIGLVHAPEPRVLDRLAPGVDLILCGHTHGGQLRIPGYGALVTNCGLDRARARGLSRFDDGLGAGKGAWLHVSAGMGTSPYAPIRFACRPEATLLTLVPRSG
jgi:predicted MPP superfamily phosphohydrolase